MLVINPDECIDCGVCEPECPAEAIVPDTEDGLDEWLEINTKFAAAWLISQSKASPLLTQMSGKISRAKKRI